jgi:PAS domain-containing protein
MKVVEPLPLHQSWPLHEQAGQFDLGLLLNCAVTDVVAPAEIGELGFQHAGCWECDLATSSLTWSGGVYDIFGLPRGTPVTREEAVALYNDQSRAVMERLRDYAIRNKRGFTMDAEVRAAGGRRRWMRLIAVPVCSGDRPVLLRGVKVII